MRGYLLDTSFITQIVVAELLFGAYKSKCIEEKEDWGLRPAHRLRSQGCWADDGDAQRETLQPHRRHRN